MCAQDQDCLGGCFAVGNAFVGRMAVVRLWERALPAAEVRPRSAGRHTAHGTPARSERKKERKLGSALSTLLYFALL
jgi:hypothetical protein